MQNSTRRAYLVCYDSSNPYCMWCMQRKPFNEEERRLWRSAGDGLVRGTCFDCARQVFSQLKASTASLDQMCQARLLCVKANYSKHDLKNIYCCAIKTVTPMNSIAE